MTSRQKLHVLIADDQPINLRVAVQVLRTLGHGGVAAKDGAQALQAWRQHSFDLLLLDVVMPQLDGVSVLREVRADERSSPQHTPVILVTGNDLPEDAEAYLREGADAVLVKPLDAEKLQSTLQKLGLG